jgi:5'-phosphate synthase pdxT subunit
VTPPRSPARPVVGVLALQGDVEEHASLLETLGATARPVRLPVDLEGLDGVVLPGGESTAISMLLESSGLFEPLRSAVSSGLPTLGTCAGMILLARRALDGRPDQLQLDAIDIVVRRNAFGSQLDSFETDLMVEQFGLPLVHAVFIRAPLVSDVGDGVEVLARLASPDEPEGRPVLCRQGTVTVAAFHPELSGETRLHRQLLSDIERRQDLSVIAAQQG